MRQNSCNAGKNEGFIVQCGDIDGLTRKKTEGAAFRELMRRHKSKTVALGILARFQVVSIGKGGRYRSLSRWFYQEPDELAKTK
jgi:hypothetical protein